MKTAWFVLPFSLVLMAPLGLCADDKVEEKAREIAGTAEFLRSVPKRFATLLALDRSARTVTLRMEGETDSRVWPLKPDAEIKRFGWWGRLDQFRPGERVWVWLALDRVNQPVAISMLCDEPSQQDIHGEGLKVEKNAPGSITLQAPRRGPVSLATKDTEAFRGDKKAKADNFKAGERLYVQTSGGSARLMLDPAAFEARRVQQKATLRQRWLEEGLPGTVTLLHPFSGEMELTLDHEAMRWARALKPGDRVTLRATPGIPGLVKSVQPWRERTLLRLVVRGADQADLTSGGRIQVTLPPPSVEVESSPFPPDLDRPRIKAERIEWFLASVYCTCSVGNDTCTGHFYTLASCNPNGCGMPHSLRETLSEKIDKGKTDRQILEELLKEQGPDLLRPHLAP